MRKYGLSNGKIPSLNVCYPCFEHITREGIIRIRITILTIVLLFLFVPVFQAEQGDRFLPLTNGIVKDTHTGLEWIAGPDRDTNWNEARSWVQSLNLDGGGWRMPTMDELESLYKKGKGDRNMTPLLSITTTR